VFVSFLCYVALIIKGRLLFVVSCQAWEIMVEGSEESKPAPVEKLLIDDMSNFQYHAAYMAYSDAYDKTSSEEGKKQLNENIVALQQNKMDCQTFYRNISQFRGEEGYQSRGYGRTMIRTQKKREWRRKTQKQQRIQRHRK
jgi:hypothetical protein